MKNKMGNLVPFYEVNGYFFSTNDEESGGSILNMDNLISNINTVKFEEKAKKAEKLKNDTNQTIDPEIILENEKETSNNEEFNNSNTEDEFAGSGNKEKLEEKRLSTIDLQNSIYQYLQKN